MVEKLSVLVADAERLRALGLASSSLLTADIFEGLHLGEVPADCGVLVGDDITFRFKLLPDLGNVLSLLKTILELTDERLPALSKDRHS